VSLLSGQLLGFSRQLRDREGKSGKNIWRPPWGPGKTHPRTTHSSPSVTGMDPTIIETLQGVVQQSVDAMKTALRESEVKVHNALQTALQESEANV